MDPDQAFEVNPETKNMKERKNTAEIFFCFKKIKIAIYFSPGLHQGRPNYRRRIQPSKENIQHFLNPIRFGSSTPIETVAVIGITEVKK
jgi:hypothetical protein